MILFHSFEVKSSSLVTFFRGFWVISEVFYPFVARTRCSSTSGAQHREAVDWRSPDSRNIGRKVRATDVSSLLCLICSSKLGRPICPLDKYVVTSLHIRDTEHSSTAMGYKMTSLSLLSIVLSIVAEFVGIPSRCFSGRITMSDLRWVILICHHNTKPHGSLLT